MISVSEWEVSVTANKYIGQLTYKCLEFPEKALEKWVVLITICFPCLQAHPITSQPLNE